IDEFTFGVYFGNALLVADLVLTADLVAVVGLLLTDLAILSFGADALLYTCAISCDVLLSEFVESFSSISVLTDGEGVDTLSDFVSTLSLENLLSATLVVLLLAACICLASLVSSF